MEELFKYYLSEEEKYALIEKLTPELPLLRAKAEISQEEIANIIGTSRQTYGAIERKARKMSWNTYLSIVMFFDYNCKTHDLLRGIGAFPEDLFYQFNPGEENIGENSFSNSPELDNLFAGLDSAGKNAVRAALITEHARCASLDKAEIIKLMNEFISAK